MSDEKKSDRTEMKIIISHGQTKREINGPFNICGSREALLALASQLIWALGDEDRRFSYGWVTIRPPGATQSVVEGPPSPWDNYVTSSTTEPECPRDLVEAIQRIYGPASTGAAP